MTEVIKTVSAKNIVPTGYKVVAITTNGQKIIIRDDMKHITA